MANELYALHYKGELIGHRYWKKDRALIRLYNLKKIYIRLADAIKCRDKLSEEVRQDVEIVRYTPANTANDELEQYIIERDKISPGFADMVDKMQQDMKEVLIAKQEHPKSREE